MRLNEQVKEAENEGGKEEGSETDQSALAS